MDNDGLYVNPIFFCLKCEFGKPRRHRTLRTVVFVPINRFEIDIIQDLQTEILQK